MARYDANRYIFYSKISCRLACNYLPCWVYILIANGSSDALSTLWAVTYLWSVKANTGLSQLALLHIRGDRLAAYQPSSTVSVYLTSAHSAE